MLTNFSTLIFLRVIREMLITKLRMKPSFIVHSTFRDYQGRILRPGGLEWGMAGDSHISYFQTSNVADGKAFRKGIVEAHNKWCYAKDLPFKTTDDIEAVSQNGKHTQVKWKSGKASRIEDNRLKNIEGLLQEDAGTSAQVWVNGTHISTLDHPDDTSAAVDAIPTDDAGRLAYKRQANGIIRIEKYFYGGLRSRSQVFAHILDNLIALEDPQVLDEQTLIGTATLPDWIMGGNLTSRLWVKELDNGDFLFLRPLYKDDISTSDRKFTVKADKDKEWIRLIREELTRLRFLAGIKHPFYISNQDLPPADPLESVRKKLAANRKPRRYFGL